MKLHNEVVEKIGELVIDLGKTAMIAGMAALFFERFRFITSIGAVVVGLLLIFWGLYSFHVLARRRGEIPNKSQTEF